MKKTTLLTLTALISSVLLSLFVTAQDSKNVAVVKMMRGNVKVAYGSKTESIKKGDWVKEGGVVKTADKSFAKLVFIDKSSINVAPNSEMVIEKFSKKEAGLLNMVKGKIRAQVSKDYLEMSKDQKSKLFVKSPSAVMGIRGTDFLFTYNPESKASSAILFEGNVAFSKLENGERPSYNNLDKVVERDNVRVYQGQFSVAASNSKAATIPAVLNVQQSEALKKGTEYGVKPSVKGKAPASVAPQAKADRPKKSVVPPGLNGKVVASENKELKKAAAQIASTAPKRSIASAAPAKVEHAPAPKVVADGYVTSDGKVKPTNGSFLHIETGVIIAPPEDATFDPNTNSYIADTSSGAVTESGEYVPPQNVEIKSSGEIVKVETNASGQKVETVLKPADSSVPVAPIVESSNDGGGILADTATQTSDSGSNIANNDVLDSNFNQNGALQDTSIDNSSDSGFTPDVNTATRARVGFQFNIN